ncbi:hypothetical protein [Spirochaeta africana]|nr:hypothetical protein [Spirochaeta africana]
MVLVGTAKICLLISALFLFSFGVVQATEYHRVTVVIEPGSSYRTTKWFGIFPVRLTPQMAVWIETAEGEMANVVYSSQSTVENRWRGADERSEALPVFNSRRGTVDAVGSATPRGDSTINLNEMISFQPGTYSIYAEVNKSFDYNDAYPEERTGVNGQPSLIYKAVIEITNARRSQHIRLTPFGTGAVDGADGAIRPGLQELTTALDILDSIEVHFSSE